MLNIYMQAVNKSHKEMLPQHVLQEARKIELKIISLEHFRMERCAHASDFEHFSAEVRNVRTAGKHTLTLCNLANDGQWGEVLTTKLCEVAKSNYKLRDYILFHD